MATPDLIGDDSATVLGSHRLAFTTDSFVVDPLFFPGGDIGRLAVAGTVNDLLTAAARPLALSASFILEEGLEIDILKAIATSMQETAAKPGSPSPPATPRWCPGVRRTRSSSPPPGWG